MCVQVKDLQRELKKRGLDTGGLKAALLQRLKEHLQQEEEVTAQEEKTKESSDKEEGTEKKNEKDKKEKVVKKGESAQEQVTGSNSGENEDKPETATLKRGTDAVDKDDNEDAPDAKKPKLTEEAENGSPQPEDEDDSKPTPTADAEKAADGDTGATREKEHRTTLRIDNFIRPFTLNAVKALVQELGNFVEDGFWMDAIKTHCFVTYPTSEIAEKTSTALNGKEWPPENGRSLSVKFADHTAMEVSQFGETKLPSRPKSKDSNDTPAPQRQKVTIDEFFQKTETKPVLYYLPLTDEEVKERKQHQSQQPEGQLRKRRHRGGRKRNRRARFRR